MKEQIVTILCALLLLGACKTSVQQNEGTFNNPVLAGFYPDPSICRVNNDYYLVNSSFSFFPGLPIFHSTDLVNWNQIGNVLDRPEQLPLNGLEISQGIYAPTLRYHEGTFYLVCTVVGGIGNFVVTATNPAGPWSNPTALPYVDGMDPDIFFDTDGKAYVTSCASPDTLLYSGHRAIKMHEFYKETFTTSEKAVTLVNGGTDITKQPIWCEGPHFYFINNYYYLLCAEGGTSIDHSVVVFRSKNVNGPYESYEKNPILTQRNFPINRPNAITNTGHADIVQTQNGEWWSVFLACRPYTDNFFNTGRETFMAPVKWEEEWPVINPDFETVQYQYAKPNLLESKPAAFPLNGNFTLRDSFNTEMLAPYWLFIRTPSTEKVMLGAKNEGLTLKLAPEMLIEKMNPAFIGRRQQHLVFEASTKLIFSPSDANEKTGIAAFQNEAHNYFLAKTIMNDEQAIVLYKSIKKDDSLSYEVLATQVLDAHEHVFLKIKGNQKSYSFYYATTENSWNELFTDSDIKYLSTEVAGGFVGTIIGMHATNSGSTSENSAQFSWFEYSGNDVTNK
jgi:alpha-N-arabinofuranosidase